LLKYPTAKIEKLVSNWKNEAMEFEQPSKFHFLAHALKVVELNILCTIVFYQFIFPLGPSWGNYESTRN